ncbi:hypothetical protein KW827_20580, partial [Pseudomonas sp. sia0905]|nr:hypothetical protein [Pseudomonas sp. sia0905]
LSTPCSARPDHLLSSGRRILQRYKPLSTPSFTAFDQPDRTIKQSHSNHPVDAGAFYSNSPPVQPLFSYNPLIYKEFSDQAAPEVVRIIGPSEIRSRDYFILPELSALPH